MLRRKRIREFSKSFLFLTYVAREREVCRYTYAILLGGIAGLGVTYIDLSIDRACLGTGNKCVCDLLLVVSVVIVAILLLLRLFHSTCLYEGSSYEIYLVNLPTGIRH